MTDQPPPDRDPAETPRDRGRRRQADGAFAALGLAAPLVQGLTALGYEEPTPIQREAIPPLLAGRDILAEAPTGTGKTAAFALPMLQRLAGEGRGQPSAPRGLVLVPTRELAMQVAEAIHRYGQPFGLHVLPVYGGQAISQQTRALRRGVDIVVATPGRAVDHLTRGPLSLDTVEVVVLDEADEMLDMGFAEDLETILSSTPPERQTALFSATISRPIARIAGTHLRDPIRVQVRAGAAAAATPPSASARSPMSSAAPTSRSRWVGSSTWRTRPRPWCSRGPAARSTSSPSAWRRTAMTWPRSTAG